MQKSKEVQGFLDKFTQSAFGRKKDGVVCVTCGKPLGEFKDEISKKEAKISGMCQVCQDEVW